MFFVTSFLGVIVLVVVGLVLKQFFWGIRADECSIFPVPARLIIGWYTFPLYGSTYLYKKKNGSIYHYINPKWRQINILPNQWSRELGTCFSVYVWFEWRTVVYGAERVSKVCADGGITHDVASLGPQGKKHPFVLDKENNGRAFDVISQSLSHQNICRLGYAFGEIAIDFVDKVLSRKLEMETGLKEKEGTGASISARCLKFYTMALLEAPLFQFSLDNVQFLQGENNLDPFTDWHKREIIISDIHDIQQGFQARDFGFIKSRSEKSKANFDKMLLNHIMKVSARQDIEYSTPTAEETFENGCENRQYLDCKQESSNNNHSRDLKTVPNSELSLLHEFLSVNKCVESSLEDHNVADIFGSLWLALDGGNAWTQMALLLLQRDRNVYTQIRYEIDNLERNGVGSIFEDHNFSKLIYLDALVFEAMRLCPPFCGGLWKVNITVELEDDKVQIPSDSNIIINAEEDRFNIEDALGKLPQNLGDFYPNKDLHCFLPLHGLEVPVMVLQTKIMIAAIVKKCDIVGIEDDGRAMGLSTQQIGPPQCSKEEERDSVEGNESTEGASVTWEESRSWYSSMPFPKSTKVVEVSERIA